VPSEVKRVLDFLDAEKFAGVLTLEIFSLEDFQSSLAVVKEWENDSR
jgi:hypothetical protein